MSDRPFRRQLLVNTFASGLANVWAMVAGLVSVPFLLGGLGREAFGVWALVMTFSATNGWLSLGDLGVVVGTTREVAARLAVGDAAGARRSVSNALVVVVGLGALGGGVLAVAALALPHAFGTDDRLVPAFRTALLLMSLQVALDLVINVVEGALEGLQRVDLSRAVDSFRRLAFVAAVSVAAVVSEDVRWVALGSLLATVVALLSAIATLHRHLPGFVVPVDRTHMRALLREGRAVAVLRPLGVIQRTMDRMLVGVVLGPGAVALVEIATQLQAGADAVLTASSYSVVPTSSWLGARGDRGAIVALAERGTKYSLLATAPIAIGVATLGAAFIDLWVGARFTDAAGLAAVACVAVLVTAPLAVGSQLLLGLGRTSTILRGASIALVVNLVVSVALLHTIGIVGAFWGTVASGVVLVLVMGPGVMDAAGTTAHRFVRVAVLPVLPPAIVQLAVALALLKIDLEPLPRLLVVGAASVAAYLAVAWLTAVDREELADLRVR